MQAAQTRIHAAVVMAWSPEAACVGRWQCVRSR